MTMQALAEILFYFYQIEIVIGIVATFAGLPVFFIFWKRMIPAPARKLFWSSRRKQPPAIIVHDSGRADITLISERRGEGVVMTESGKYKLLPRFVAKEDLTKARLDEETAEATEDPPDDSQLSTVDKVKAKMKNYVYDYSAWVVKRAILVGLDMPIFLGYSGKATLFNPEMLALWEAGELKIQTEDGMKFNPNKIADKKIEDAVQPLMLLDPKEIKRIINAGFDDSQIAAIAWDSEQIGLYGRGIGRYLPWIMIIAVVGIAIAVIFFLPNIMKMVQGGVTLFNPIKWVKALVAH